MIIGEPMSAKTQVNCFVVTSKVCHIFSLSLGPGVRSGYELWVFITRKVTLVLTFFRFLSLPAILCCMIYGFKYL